MNYRVLVAEDNPVNRELMIEMLTELNVKHDAVENGHGVLNKVMDKHYDLILMDSRLPDLDGHEVSSRIRSMKTVAKQPVIIATSSDNSLKNQQLSLESGVDGFLNKPITMNDLTVKLNAWLPFNDIEMTKANTNADSTVVNLFSAPILDLNVLETLRERDENNAGFMNKLFGIFIDDTFERIELLKKQLADGEYVDLSKTIHSIKSGCDHVGAKRMSRYCSVISNMARNQSYTETQRALQHFIEEFDRVIIELNKEMECEVTT